jgi:hypothetical protein
MKLGYSILLGEHIKAHTIDYSDCKAFQIVCPNCKEPVFKVFREQPPPGVHYLSHYEKDKSYETECELRVKSITNNDIEHGNTLSRGQRLEYFLSVLKEAIVNAVSRITYCPENEAHKRIVSITSSSGPQRFRNSITKALRHESKSRDLLEHRVTYILKFWTNRGFKLSTSFAMETQKRIVKDVFVHILSAKAQANFSYLFGAAYMTVINGAIQAIEAGNSDPNWQVQFGAMTGLIEADRHEADFIIQGLREIHTQDHSLLQAITHSIANEMVFILWVLPYFELLKRFQA